VLWINASKTVGFGPHGVNHGPWDLKMAEKPVRAILYIWMPCKKVYPVGLTYLANHVHRHHPEVQQQILDLSLIPKRKRRENLLKTVRDFNPDLVLFSWRDIQVFAPHEGDPSLKYAFNFYYSQNPIKRIGASLKGLQFLLSYYQGIRENLSYPWQIHRHFPEKKMMIGGGRLWCFCRTAYPTIARRDDRYFRRGRGRSSENGGGKGSVG